MSSDESGKRRLTRTPGSEVFPVWSPDGRKIAFLRIGDPEHRGLYVVNADGSGQRKLADEASLAAPDWSPHGQKIVFVSNRDGRAGCIWQPACNTEIYVMNADGSGQRNLTRNPARDDDPVWSPDGRKIAFVSRRDGKPEVYVMNADGSGQRNLTRNPGRDTAPAWSPDGRTIAFHSDRDRNSEIYVMNADGSGQRNLTRYRFHDVSFAWSPAQK